MFTILVHFIIGIKPVLLLQIFSTPYHFIENRLFRKHVLGLKPGYRVWGERFDGEVEAERIKEDGEGEGQEGTEATTGKASAMPAEGGGASATETTVAANESSVGVVVGTEADEIDGTVPVADATIAEVQVESVLRVIEQERAVFVRHNDVPVSLYARAKGGGLIYSEAQDGI